MKTELYGRCLTSGDRGFPQDTGGVFPHFQPRPRSARTVRTAENQSPYPGIYIGSASELLDFRFNETEILQEGEDLTLLD